MSDLAFVGDYAIAGNYHGFRIIDISDPADPTVVRDVWCPGPQNGAPSSSHRAPAGRGIWNEPRVAPVAPLWNQIWPCVEAQSPSGDSSFNPQPQ